MTTDVTSGGARVLLVGMMGAGKTTVGTAVSALTGWPYLDNDELLQRRTGRGAAELLHAHGAAELRRAEAAILDAILESPAPLIGSIASGVVVDPQCRQRLQDGAFVVYLRVPIEELVRRLAADRERPWLGDDARSALTALEAGRDALYFAIADLVLDTPEQPPDALARRIVEAASG